MLGGRIIDMGNWYHVVPQGDLIEHSKQGESECDCKCQPKILLTERVVIHNAIDNREFDEIADKINK
jgi:hypothetical protein